MQAIIENSKVIGIVNLDVMNDPHFKLGQFSWDIGDFDVQIGDDFIDGKFMRNGQPVKAFVRSSELNERLTELDKITTDNSEMILNMQYENDMKDLGGAI